MNIVYTKLNFKHLSRLASGFGLEFSPNWKLLSGGSNNSNYLVESGGVSYILTICDGKSPEEVEAYVSALNYLEKNGFQTSKCYPAQSGALFITYDNKPVILKSFIPGKVPDHLTPVQAWLLGVEIGKLHRIPTPAFLPDTIEYDLKNYDLLKNWTHSAHTFLKWLNKMKEYLVQNLPPGLPKCMIHGDIFCDNLVLQGDRPVILDFEEISYYERIFDLGMAIIGCCRTKDKVDLYLVHNLLRGYQKIIRLSEDEKISIRLFAIYSAVGTAYWRFKQFHITAPDDRYKDRYLEMCRLTEDLMSLQDKDFI